MCRCATETTFECNVASAGGDRLARQVSCCGRYSMSVARKSGKAYSHNPSICYSYELRTLIRRAGCEWCRVECARRHHCSDARLHIHIHAHTAGRRSTRFWSQGAGDGSSGASRGDLFDEPLIVRQGHRARARDRSARACSAPSTTVAWLLVAQATGVTSRRGG